MKSKLAILIAVTASLSAVGAVSASANSVLYSYTGNPFTIVQSPYTTSDSVTASIVLSAALGDSLTDANVTPTSYTLTDGQQTNTNLNSIGSTLFQFSTNATGKITDWTIETNTLVGLINTQSISSEMVDVGQLTSTFALGENLNNPGKWAGPNQPIASTPLPAALPLFATGLGAMGLFGWRKKRKAAAALAAA
jgi:hypothetical protein